MKGKIAMYRKDIEKRLESIEENLKALQEFVTATRNGFIVVEQMNKDASALAELGTTLSITIAHLGERVTCLEQGKEEPPKWIT